MKKDNNNNYIRIQAKIRKRRTRVRREAMTTIMLQLSSLIF